MGNFNGWIFPEFCTKPRVAEGIPDDFDAAIALFLKQQEKQSKLCDEIANLLIQTEQWFGDEFRGEDEYETIGTLQAELEAVAEKEKCSARDWNAHIHGLKATFDLVLKNLEHVRSAATSVNRAFAKVQVSNLKAVKLEVLEQSDLVSWIRRLAAFEPAVCFIRTHSKSPRFKLPPKNPGQLCHSLHRFVYARFYRNRRGRPAAHLS